MKKLSPKEATELDGMVEANFGRREARRLRRSTKREQTRALNELIYRKSGPLNPADFPIPRNLFDSSMGYVDDDDDEN